MTTPASTIFKLCPSSLSDLGRQRTDVSVKCDR
jgi:hypothetical protein